jgi:hypothetical protein
MKNHHIAVAFCALCIAAVGIAAGSLKARYHYCPNPSTSVTALCQTFESAGATAVARSEALQIGLLLPYLQPGETQPRSEPDTQFAQIPPSNDDVP